MIRKRITFANVTSFLALFVALSAGSYAAVKLPANSVGSKQIKAKAVTSAKLGSKAVTSPKVAANAINGSNVAANALDGSKVKDGSLSGSDINLTTLGKVPSAASADTAGSAAIARLKAATGVGTSRANTSGNVPFDSATATCDSGLVATGGGVELSDPADQLILDSFRTGLLPGRDASRTTAPTRRPSRSTSSVLRLPRRSRRYRSDRMKRYELPALVRSPRAAARNGHRLSAFPR